MARERHDNLKMLNQIRKELSKDLSMITPAQREEFFKGAEDVYEGLKKWQDPVLLLQDRCYCQDKIAAPDSVVHEKD